MAVRAATGSGGVARKPRSRRARNPAQRRLTPCSDYVGHNGRAYVCLVARCEKTFKRSEHVKRHVRAVHMKERPYPCPHGCGRSFSRHDNLKQHTRTHLKPRKDDK